MRSRHHWRFISPTDSGGGALALLFALLLPMAAGPVCGAALPAPQSAPSHAQGIIETGSGEVQLELLGLDGNLKVSAVCGRALLPRGRSGAVFVPSVAPRGSPVATGQELRQRLQEPARDAHSCNP